MNSSNNLEGLPDELRNNISTLKDVSYDNDNNEYMTNSNLKVIDFDKVKENYIKNNMSNVKPNPKSNDALYLSKDGVWTFIEFKNGSIRNNIVFDINKKIYDSLFILFDIDFKNSEIEFNNTISFSRSNINYILVYNKKKYDQNGPTGLCDEGIKRQKSSLQQSKSRDYLSKRLFSHAKENFILFGLDQFKGYFFKEVFTYTKEEFEKNFVEKCE
ncbi:hypothetical protein [Clostridium sp.]|uniref:hypothetical protein n=1 Tax=Clostridium sp. TaxID=1506 RepID=UPI0026215D33|nr:hypothetical protein [Clostridium sp.]